MAELGDLKKHVDEAENLFRKTEEQHKHCRERLIALIASVESRRRDNRNEIERNRAEYDGLTQSSEQLKLMLLKLQGTLESGPTEPPTAAARAAENVAKLPATAAWTVESAAEKIAPQASMPEDPEKIRRGLRRALAKARAPRTVKAPRPPPAAMTDEEE